MPSLGFALCVLLAATAAGSAAPDGGMIGKPLQGNPLAGKSRPPQKWSAGVTRNNSRVCKVMVRLLRVARRLLGDSPAVTTDEECSRLHELYLGPHLHPKFTAYGYKVPADCLGYIGIFKSGSTETLCNLRNKFGKREKWAQGMSSNFVQRAIAMHMFPVENESAGAVNDRQAKYFEDNPQDLARADREGRPRHGTGFTWVRDPAQRFVSGYSEIEYYFTVGEPYFFHDLILQTPKARETYVPGRMVNDAKSSCQGCTFYKMKVNSSERAKAFVLDFLRLDMLPGFLWRHVFPQVMQVNTFVRNAGPLDFIGQLESFRRGWEFIGMLTNRTMDHFNRSCRGHDYSGSGAGFGPRETMHRMIFGAGEGSSETCAAGGAGLEACKDESGEAASLIAKSLGCALLLPDYVCFGYANIVEPEDCVAAGFASSLHEWEKIERYIRKKMCPGVRRWIGGKYDSGPLGASSVQELFDEKRAAQAY